MKFPTSSTSSAASCSSTVRRQSLMTVRLAATTGGARVGVVVEMLGNGRVLVTVQLRSLRGQQSFWTPRFIGTDNEQVGVVILYSRDGLILGAANLWCRFEASYIVKRLMVYKMKTLFLFYKYKKWRNIYFLVTYTVNIYILKFVIFLLLVSSVVCGLLASWSCFINIETLKTWNIFGIRLQIVYWSTSDNWRKIDVRWKENK